MESVGEAVHVFLVLAVGLVLPQVLGYLGYRWARNKSASLRTFPFLIPPVVFFASAYVFWEYQAKVVRDEGHRVCGAMGAAASLSTMFGTLFHLVVGAILLTVLNVLWTRKTTRRFITA
jgi:hypothetical protein